MRIIGLCGYANTGKDEVGRILQERGWTRFAKGDLLKDAAYRVDPTVVLPGENEATIVTLRHLVDKVGWEEAKTHDAVRRFLQDIADEVTGVCGRDVWNDRLYEDILGWAKIMERAGRPADVVLTRLSLPTEVDLLEANRGALVRVTRPGCGPVNDHPNETALDSTIPAFTLTNDGTLEDLEARVETMVEMLTADLWS